MNIVSEEIAEKMNLTSGDYPYGTDEFEIAGLTPVASDLVRPRAGSGIAREHGVPGDPHHRSERRGRRGRRCSWVK